MQISLNGRFLTRRPTGVDRFAYEVIAAIDQLLGAGHDAVKGLRLRVLLPPGAQPVRTFDHIATVNVGRRGGQAWEQLDLPQAARGDSLLVNLCNTAPIWSGPQLTVIHDAATARVPHSYGRLFRLWYRLMIPAVYRRSAAVCTVSEFSRADLADLYGARADVRVLPEGTEHMSRVASEAGVLDRHGLRRRPYVLAVSSLSPHKNFAAVVQAVETMSDAGFDVVIAGGQNPQVFAAGHKPLPDSVKYVGYVSDGELKALYENAACFVFPSFYEGYGLPPTEAMACGCPVVAARAASIPEVCGNAALYFDPHNAADLAAVLRQVMADKPLRDSLRARGRERAAELQWNAAALGLLQEIRRVVAP